MIGRTGEIRTPNLKFRRLAFYPIELRSDYLARELGLEPRMTESKSVVLPLHYSPTETGLPTWIRTKTLRPQTANATR